jgi:hypothetical protein
MNKYLLYSILSIHVSALRLMAALPEYGGKDATSAVVETNGYRFMVCSTNLNYAVGDKILIDAILENASSNTVTVVLADPFKTYQIHVVMPDGRNASLTSYGKKRAVAAEAGGSVATRSLEAGEKITQSFCITEIFEMNSGGTYQVTISRWIRTHDDHEASIITAPPLKISLKKNE